MDLPSLEAFIVAAKRATYVGNGEQAEPSRIGSHDLTFASVDREAILHARPDRLDVWAEPVITGRSLEEILG